MFPLCCFIYNSTGTHQYIDYLQSNRAPSVPICSWEGGPRTLPTFHQYHAQMYHRQIISACCFPVNTIVFDFIAFVTVAELNILRFHVYNLGVETNRGRQLD